MGPMIALGSRSFLIETENGLPSGENWLPSTAFHKYEPRLFRNVVLSYYRWF